MQHVRQQREHRLAFTKGPRNDGQPGPVQPVKITELLGRGRLCLTHAKNDPAQTEARPQDCVTRRRLSTNRRVAAAHIRWPSPVIRCGPGSNRTGTAQRLLPGLFRR
jgi:hypothetical protein